MLDLAQVKNAEMALTLAVAMLQHASVTSHCAGLVYDLFKVAKNQGTATQQLQVCARAAAVVVLPFAFSFSLSLVCSPPPSLTFRQPSNCWMDS